MTFEIYLGIGAIVGILVVIIGNIHGGLFDKHYNFADFLMVSLERAMIFVVAALGWPGAVIVGLLWAFYQLSNRTVRESSDY